MNLPNLGWFLLAQTAGSAGSLSSGTAATTTTSDSLVVWVLALKRWYGSLTLSSPDALPSRFAFEMWMLGLLLLLGVTVGVQGPRRFLGQLFDLAGLFRLLGGGIGRLKISARLVAILLGVTVISWTAWQAPLHSRPEKKEELGLLLKSKTRSEFALEQGALSALTPMRDFLSLGDTLVLLVGGAALVFKFSADRWGRFEDPATESRIGGGWTTVCWGAAGLYAMYRVASLIVDLEGLPPLGGCLSVESVVVPGLMLLSDGLLLAWVLAELRGATRTDEGEGFDVASTLRLVPGATLACALGLPARYIATAVGLILFHHTTQAPGAPVPAALSFLRGWSLVWIQVAAIPFTGLIAGVSASNGTIRGSLVGFARVLRDEGGRLVAVIVFTSICVGATSAVAYFGVLAMPVQPWILLAADSYAHYLSVPIGLVGVAAMVELASRVRPSVSSQKIA